MGIMGSYLPDAPPIEKNAWPQRRRMFFWEVIVVAFLAVAVGVTAHALFTDEPLSRHVKQTRSGY